MKWERGRESDNVVEGGSDDFGGGSGLRLGLGAFRLGIPGIIVLLIISWFLGINSLVVLESLSSVNGGDTHVEQPVSAAASNDPQIKFVRSILGSTEDVWGSYFQRMGRSYEQPRLVLFERYTRSGCGSASAASGPFYCFSDHEVYLDLNFFKEMESRFHASGDFARAYVIAHEVGHHVQNLLGITARVEKAQRSGQPMEGANGLSVRLELQADCFAGVWANRSEAALQWLQEGDIESALNAANQIGDDTLEAQSQGYVVPDSFTHGTSAQRVRWFKNGFHAGDINGCDTFGSGL